MGSMFKEEFAELAIFKGLSDEQIQLLDQILELCQFTKDQLIFEQGQTADYLYILVDGEVTVRYKPYDGPVLTVARITPGGVFGWSAALGRQAFTSGAIAEGPSRALRISGVQLHSFCECNPEIGAVLLERLAGVIAQRLRNTHTEVLTILTKGMDLSADCWKRIKKDD